MRSIILQTLHIFLFIVLVSINSSSAFTWQQQQQQQRRNNNNGFFGRLFKSSLSSNDESSSSRGVINEDYITLSSKYDEDDKPLKMQVLSSFPTSETSKPLLLFLHGSFHGAWCWSEHYFNYFTKRGYPVVALNWRGTGGTPVPENIKKIQILQHVQDLYDFLQQLPQIIQQYGWEQQQQQIKPVVICHSFGGLPLMKYLEIYNNNNNVNNNFRGIITMCSLPPSGGGSLTLRYLRRSLIQSYRITVGFAMKKAITNPTLCRQLFFGGEKIVDYDNNGNEIIIEDYGISDDDVIRYQSYFKRDSAATIDLSDLSKKLPSKKADVNGKAPFDTENIPCLVIGACDDYLIDNEALIETSKYFDCEKVIVDSPHDIMLGSKWENGAKTIENFIE